jgi:integrase
VRKKLLTQNPVSDGVEKYTPQSRTKNALMPPEVHQGILKYLEDRNFTHFGRLVRFWRHTGCRPFEASCLLVSDFQPAARRCVIPYERMPRSKRSKSREKDRIIYLDSEAFSLVRTSCEGRGPEERIFTMPNGKPWYKDTIGNKWGDVRRKVKFPKGIMPYSYRHSWITDALTSGIPAAIVAEFCGTSIAMIDKTYGHLDARPEKMLEILALIERK